MGTSNFVRQRGIPTLEELVARITPKNRHKEIDWGPDVGKEIIECSPAMSPKREISSGWILIRTRDANRPIAACAGVTDQGYNRASGLVVVCPLTRIRKPYPFALPVVVDQVEGAVLVDHLKKHGLESARRGLPL